jgi:hypothetical protein
MNDGPDAGKLYEEARDDDRCVDHRTATMSLACRTLSKPLQFTQPPIGLVLVGIVPIVGRQLCT